MINRTPLTLSLMCSVIALSTAAAAQDQPLDTKALLERLVRLENELAELKSQHAAGREMPVAKEKQPPMAVAVANEDRSPLEDRSSLEETIENQAQAFNLRGRLQYDLGHVTGSGKLNDPGLGTTTEVRRVRIGTYGDVGDFSYVVEADFANNGVSVEDALFVWNTQPVSLIFGQHKPWASQEEQTDDLFVPFMERAAFTTAFQFGFKLGISAVMNGDDYSLRAGILSDGSLTGDDETNGYTFSTRANYGPAFGNGRLHMAASMRHRDFSSNQTQISYDRKPQINTTDTTLLNTGALAADADTFYGLELGTFMGPFYATAEWAGLSVNASDTSASNPFFSGGFIGAGYVLTGEAYPYDPVSGTVGSLKPARPVSKGGIGALVLNARFDYLDLSDNDAAINGGTQEAFMLGLTWIPNNHVRFLANYSHVRIDGGPFAAIANAGDLTSDGYSVNVLGLRGQIHW